MELGEQLDTALAIPRRRGARGKAVVEGSGEAQEDAAASRTHRRERRRRERNTPDDDDGAASAATPTTGDKVEAVDSWFFGADEEVAKDAARASPRSPRTAFKSPKDSVGVDDDKGAMGVNEEMAKASPKSTKPSKKEKQKAATFGDDGDDKMALKKSSRKSRRQSVEAGDALVEDM